MFIYTMQFHFCWPKGFFQDERYSEGDLFEDNEKLTTYNADIKAKEIINRVQTLAT